jgi:5,10-methenyltetrahydromethanopterin hydrogenase
MDKLIIVKLENEPYDFLVIAASCENPLTVFGDMFGDIEGVVGEGKARILFDMTLVPEFKGNRYVAYDYEKGKNPTGRFFVVRQISDRIKDVIYECFSEED